MQSVIPQNDVTAPGWITKVIPNLNAEQLDSGKVRFDMDRADIDVAKRALWAIGRPFALSRNADIAANFVAEHNLRGENDTGMMLASTVGALTVSAGEAALAIPRLVAELGRAAILGVVEQTNG